MSVGAKWSVEVDRASRLEWSEALRLFDDATLYQTWDYAEKVFPRQKAARVIVRREGELIGMAQARLVATPVIGRGIAYVAWGPLWRRRDKPEDRTALAAVVEAAREEFGARRKLVVRLMPNIYSDEGGALQALAAAGFVRAASAAPRRTLLLDLTRPLDEIRKNLAQNWRNHLKHAEKNALEVVEGTSEDAYRELLGLYDRMRTRKDFDTGVDPHEWAALAATLPEAEKMRIFTARHEGRTVSALALTAMGAQAINLLRASSDEGLKLQAAYLVLWRAIESLKEAGHRRYDLGGIDPEGNPGVYHFKAGTGGKDATHIGTFEYSESAVSTTIVALGERLRSARKNFGKARPTGAGAGAGKGRAPAAQTSATRTKDASGLSVSVHTNLDELVGIAGEWDEFVGRAGGDVYATFDWARTWWEFYGGGRTLEVALVRRGERLAGIFPMFRETLRPFGFPTRLVRLIGCDHSVTTADIVVEPGAERDVIAAWAESLGGGWDAIMLGPLPGYDGRAKDIASAMEQAFRGSDVGYRGDVRPQTLHDLPATYDEYLRSLPKKERGNILRKERTMREKHEVRASAVTGAEAVAAFDRFLPLHQNLWQGKGRLGHFEDWPKAVEFHRALVERLSGKGRALFFEMACDGRVVASKYCFVFGPRIHTFMTGRDDGEPFRNYGLGAAAYTGLVQYALGNGATMIDALGGYYEHKLRLGGRLASWQAITVTRRAFRARLARAALGASWRLWNLFYYKLWFNRIAPLVGKKPLRETWIRLRS